MGIVKNLSRRAFIGGSAAVGGGIAVCAFGGDRHVAVVAQRGRLRGGRVHAHRERGAIHGAGDDVDVLVVGDVDRGFRLGDDARRVGEAGVAVGMRGDVAVVNDIGGAVE